MRISLAASFCREQDQTAARRDLRATPHVEGLEAVVHESCIECLLPAPYFHNLHSLSIVRVASDKVQFDFDFILLDVAPYCS